MNAVFGIRWDDGRRVRLTALLFAAAAAAALMGLLLLARQDGGPSMASVVVVEQANSGNGPERLVERLGGEVGRHIRLIDGFAAKVPANRLDELRRGTGVRFAAPDRQVELSSKDDPGTGPATSLQMVREELGIRELANRGITGRGVDIALVDSGVVPGPGLDDPDKVVNGPDFSSDARSEELRFLDSYGHGTHLAGIMAANDPDSGFAGIAPDARIVNAKVAATDGSTSLMRLLIAMDWVVRNRNSDDLNVRVLNLSVGMDVVGSYTSDPLAYAAEQAWKKGIVVVAAVGSGNSRKGIDSPAADPFVVAAGASATGDTTDLSDNTIPDWSRLGTAKRNPDLVAPGKSLVSLRVPGSFIDQAFPGGRVGENYMRGSGTSQATAVTSASAALLLQARPALTPDQVKDLLVSSATPVSGNETAEGAGQIDVRKASDTQERLVKQLWKQADLRLVSRVLQADPDHGNGRHDNHDRDEGDDWDGPGKHWSASRWSASRWSASRWSASRWSASRWSADLWGTP